MWENYSEESIKAILSKWSKLKGSVVKLTKRNSFKYRGRLIAVERNAIIIDDVLLGLRNIEPYKVEAIEIPEPNIFQRIFSDYRMNQAAKDNKYAIEKEYKNVKKKMGDQNGK